MNTTTNATFLGHNFLALRRMGAAAALLLLLGVGARAQSSGSLNTSFNPGTGANSRVLGIARQGDGKLVIGGQFTTFNGVARGRVARLNYDGSVDTSFNPGSGPDSTVSSVAVAADGKVVAGGDFFSASGVARNRLARFNVDGSLDLTFAPVVNGTIQAVAVDSAGRVYLAGSFTLVNGVSRLRLARLNIDGTLDLTFASGTGPNSSVLGLELQSDGKVLLAGYFSSVNGVTRHRVARLNTDGTVDTTFVPGTLDNGYANFVSVGSDGKVLVGGGLYVGLNSRLLRLNPNGSVDTTFNVGNNVINSDVTAAVSHANGTVIIAGYFTAVNGVSRNSVARLLANGTLDTAFNPGVGADNRITQIVLEPDGSFVAGGDFTTYQGVSRNRITRIHSLFINQAPIFTVTNSTILEDSVLASVTVTGIAAGPVGDGLTVVPQAVTNLTATSSDPALVPDPLVTYTPGATTATLAFTPLANATGTVTITVVAQDNAGTANSGNDRGTNTFTLTVAPVNDVPSFTLATNALSAVGVVGEQSVSAFAANILAGPVNETGQTVSFLVANNNNALFSTQPAIDVNGTLTFTPAVMANGVATVTVNAQDDGGTANGGVDTSAAQTFTLTVISGNVPPSASYITNNVVVLEDAAAQSVSTFAAFSVGPVAESTQTVSVVSVTAANPSLFSSQPALAANGTLTFTPAANANGATLVTVVVADDGGTASGGADRATNTFTITVAAVNDAPGFAVDSGLLNGGGGGLQTSATVVGWGRNDYGQATGLSGVTALAAGGNHSLALKSDGTVVAWGLNNYGQATVPAGLSGVTALAAGQYHSLALKSDGTVVAWGNNDVGQATVPAGLSGVTALAAGQYHSLALKSDGTVVAWGYNYFSQATVPAGLSGVTALAAGGNHSLALKSDGTVVAWGSNGNGQATVPAGLSGVTALAAGGEHSLALKSDGTVVVWGLNNYGQVTPPAGLSGVTALAAGGEHSLALKSDGTVVAWGLNNYGQITPPAGLSGVTALAVGYYHSLALFTTGTAGPANTLTVLEDAGLQSLSLFTTNILAGPPNESSQPVSFTVTNDANALFLVQPAISTAGTLTFTPAANAFGTATITVIAQDDGGTANSGVDTSAAQTFTITVNAVNDAPVITFAASLVVVAEDSGATNLVGFATVTTGPANESSQTITNFTVTSDNPTLFSVAPALTGGALSFTPAAGANGSAVVTVVAQDDGGTDNGGANQTTRTFTITVLDLNDPPVITFASNVVVLQDSGAASLGTFATLSTGPANESSQSITNLSVSNDNTVLFSAQPALSGGTLTFTPALNAVGTATVTVIAQDDGGTANGGVDKATNTFTISVIGVNHAPTFALRPVNTQSSLLSNGSFETGSFTGWTATDTANSTPTLAVRANGANLGFFNVVSSDGTYSATHGFSGAAAGSISIAQDVTLPPGGGATLSFTYRAAWQTFGAAGDRVFRFAVQPSGGGADLASQTILTATPNSFVFQTASTPVTVDLSAFAGQTVRVVFVTDIAAGDAGNGSFQLDNVQLSATTPNFTVYENSGASSTLNFATNILAGPPGEAAQTVAFLVANNNNGLFSSQPAVAADGTLTFTPAPDANGTATVTVRAQDNGGTDNGGVDTSVAHTFTITLLPLNSAPRITLNTDELVVNEDRGAYSGTIATITTGPADESGQSITNVVTSNDNNTLFSVQPAVSAAGVLTFTPTANANGSAVVTFTAQDNGGTANGGVNLATNTFTITVTPVNDAPSFVIPVAAVVTGQRLMAWGSGFFLGSSGGDRSVPTPVIATGVLAGKNVLAVSVGGAHTMVLCTDGTIVTWGDNTYGQLGKVQANGTTPVGGGPTPVAVDASGLLAGKTVVAISAGRDHSMALCSDGTVAVWGRNNDGQLGDGTTTQRNLPVAVSVSGVLAGKTVAAISAGGFHSVALCSDGTVATWGYGGSGQLGNNSTASSSLPVLVSTSGVLAGKSVVKVTGLYSHNLAVCSDGTVVAWGANNSSKLGDGSGINKSVPVAVNMSGVLAGKTVVAFGGGPGHSLALCSDGTVAAWGANDNGQLGNNTTVSSATPVAVNSFGVLSGRTVVEIAGGGNHSMALCSDGTLAAWGGNAFGKLGDNSTTDRLVPVAVSTSTLSSGERFILVGQSNSEASWAVALSATTTLGGGTVTVAEDSGPYTTNAFATSISPGPADESAQTVSFNVSNNNNPLFSSQPALAADGTLTFTTAANAFGSATVTVQLHDDGGTANSGVDTSAAQSFTITVTNVNNAPTVTLAQSTVTVLEDSGSQTASGFATVTSFGPGESSQTLVGHVVTAASTSLFSVQPAINTSGVLTFTPAANANGTTTVTVVSQDSGGTANGGVDKSTNTFTITITAVNDAPSFALPAGPLGPAGATWTDRSSAGSRDWRSIASSADGSKLAAVAIGGLIWTSTDGGATWTDRSSAGSWGWSSIASSADGSKLAAVVYGGDIWTSTDGGATWTDRSSAGSRNWRTIASAADGSKLAAAEFGGDIWTSTDGGATWTDRSSAGSRNWLSIASSADGSKLAAGALGGDIWTSTDGGATWTDRSSAGSRDWPSIASSADGSKLAAVVYGGDIWTSTDGGATWTDRSSAGSRIWHCIASSADGSKLAAAVDGGDIWTSTDGGATWTDRSSAGSRLWWSIASSSDGSKLAAVVYGGDIWTSVGTASPYVVTVLEDSGAYSANNVAMNISPGPADESGQTVSFTVTNDFNALFSVQPAIAADGTLTFTPAANAFGSATVTVTAVDSGSGTLPNVNTSAAQTFTITVTPVNDRPSVTLAGNVTRNEDSGAYSQSSFATFSAGNASESGQAVLAYTVSNSSNALFSVQPAISTAGTLTFTPAANAYGVATVTVSVQDNGGTANGGVDASAEVTFTITINSLNDAPSFALASGPLMPAGTSWTLQSAYPQSDTPTIGYSPDGSRLMAGQWGGHSYLSTDHGVTWGARNTDTTRAYQGGFAFSADGSRIYAAPRYAPMLTSADGGTTWTTLPLTPGNNGFWTGVACSSSGQVVIGGNGDFGYLYTSTDYGATWTAHHTDAVRGWGSVAVSSDGTMLAAASYARASGSIPDRIYISTDSGATWTARGPTAFWTGVACSADGTKLVGTTDGGQIHTSTDGGLTWTARESVRSWGRPVSSADGNTLLTVASGFMYRSTDAGETWVQETTRSNWRAVTMTADGTRFAATLAGAGGQVYTSSAQAGPYVVTVVEDSGASTVAGVATSISAGPADESGQTVSFTVANNNNALFSSQPAIAADGTLTFTPTGNLFGSATVTVTAVDSGPGTPPDVNTSAAQTFTITVANVNEAPTVAFSAATVTVLEDSGLNTVSGFASVTSFGPNESSQTLLGHVVTAADTALFSVQPAINTSGVLTFTPAANANGSTTVTVVSQDSGGTAGGGVDKTTNTFTITITAVNDAPSFALPAGPIGAAGGTWTAQASGSREWRSIASSADGSKLVAATYAGQIYTSTDSGVTWTARESNRIWFSVASSADGSKLAAVVYGGQIYTSTDSGVTWTARESARDWRCVASSADGSKLVALPWGGQIYTSTDSGETWMARENSRQWHSLASSADGTKLVAGVYDGHIYTSTDSGETWTERESSRRWVAAASSADGSKLVAGVENSQIYTSTDSGATWTPRESSRNWYSVASSADGNNLVATPYNGQIYTSTDSGVNWTARESNRQWFAVASSSDGSKLVAAAREDLIYTSVGAAGPYTLMVNEDSGAQSVAAFATAISKGPADESDQTVTFTVNNDNNALFSSQPAIGANGTLTFTPAADASGSATVTVTAQDDGGTANSGVDTSAAQTFTITVTPVNEAPTVALAQTTVTALEDSGASSVSGFASVTTFGPGESGQTLLGHVVTAADTALFSVQPAINTSGVLTFTPATNANGSTTVTVVSQDSGGTAGGGVDKTTNTFTITITPVNDAPGFALPPGAPVPGVFGWGYNSERQIGDGTTSQRNSPVLSQFGNVIQLAGGDSHSLSLKADGTVWAVGNNSLGQLGDGTTTARSAPTQVASLAGIIQISANFAQSFALKSDGTLWAWGYNGEGELGDGSTTARSTPVQVLTQVSHVSAGRNHTVAVKSDGTVWAWGYNAYGQLGDGTTTDRHSPVQVPGLSGAVKAAAGGFHSVALFADSTLKSWGSTENGQGGTGSGGRNYSPVVVKNAANTGPLTGVVGVVAGSSATFALMNDATLMAFGFQTGGLGQGLTSPQTLPVAIPGMTDVTAVAAGFFHVLALRGDATLWSWGYNASGQLGDGTTANRETPAQVAGLSNVTFVAAGYQHSFAVAAAGVGLPNVSAVENSGVSSSLGFASTINAGPADESAQVVGFLVSNDNNALFSVQPAIAANGTLTFTPAGSGTGTATVTVYAQDDGGTDNGGVDIAGPQTFTITITPVPTRVYLGSTTTVAPDTFELPILLEATGTESAVGFTLNFDTNRLTFSSAANGADALSGSASSVRNTTQAQNGRLGILITKDTGVTFAAGTRELVRITFTVNAGATLGTTPVTFTDAMSRREVVNALAEAMPAAFVDGSVNITAAPAGTPSDLEGDVSHRPFGNGTVTVTDTVQISRFAAGLDVATTANGEFQRADCAPLGTKGDGRITVADWLQAQRFAATLDTPGTVGGPAMQAAGLLAASAKLSAGTRVVRVAGGNLVAGQANTVSVQLDSQGNEAGISLSLSYDPTALSFVSATTTSGGSLIVNSVKAAAGKLGLVLVMPAGTTIAAGTKDIVTLTFNATGSGATAISVTGDSPVAREVADVNANVLGASFVGGSFNIILPAGLKAAGMERAADGSLRLVVRNADGTPITAAQAAKYEVHVTSNLGGVWTVLPNALVVENGALKIVDPAANGAGLRLYKLVETP